MSRVTKHRKATVKRVEKKHTCPNCDAKFSFPNKLRLHVNSNHSLANVCELCPERFNRFNELRTHMRRAHRIIHQCHLCAYSSSVKAELRKHVVKCHENGVRCTVDGCTATVAYNRLRRHIKEVHCNSFEGNLILDNQILGESAESENNLSEDPHAETKLTSTAEGSVATNAFFGIEFINIHVVDKMQKPTNNHVSPKIPSQNTEMSSHMSSAVQHNGAISGNDCSDYCDGVKLEMERGNSRNICREKSLEVPTQLDTLEMKDKTMSEKLPFDCTETGEYECQKCGKTFYNVCNSRRHWNRVHLKMYKERVKLKKYACEISNCIQRFSCSSKLQDHILTVHNEGVPFNCETCSRKFSSRASFAVHLRRYHLASIRDVPHGFMDRTVVNATSISDEIRVAAHDTVSEIEVVADNIFAKE
uniref:Zinc finger protein n=1 Tax=Wuchereria bancrofti TaxID=6293 RepID=A0AAF5PY96_WUCBA